MQKILIAACIFLLAAAVSLAQGTPSSSISSAKPASKKPAAHHPVAHHSVTHHATTSSHGKSSVHRISSKSRRRRKSSWRSHGQQNIKDDRALAIQQALIREHYLSGHPTGEWDSATQAAMVRYQAAHSWQTKVVPDSRALISLGLGPDREHLLNPESAMTTGPQGQHPVSTSASPKSVSSAPSSTSLPAATTPADPNPAASGLTNPGSANPDSTNPASINSGATNSGSTDSSQSPAQNPQQ